MSEERTQEMPVANRGQEMEPGPSLADGREREGSVRSGGGWRGGMGELPGRADFRSGLLSQRGLWVPDALEISGCCWM